jgi:large subunit ribosomal protein L17
MRHRVAGRKLSRHTQHRELMFRNMLVSLFDHERIKTTLPKAKELRILADKIITLGKKDNLHARRRVFALLRSREIVKKLFDDIAPRFKERAGGYTRIYKIGWRQGDAAPLSLIELVTLGTKTEGKKPTGTVEKAKAVLKKVTPKKKEKKKETEKGAKAEKGAKKEKKEKKEGKKEIPKAKSKKEPAEEKKE